jgi:hypothetical protein
MALKYATSSAETNQVTGSSIYESKDTLSAPGTGPDILLPDEAGRFDSVLVMLSVSGGGTGKVQYTLSNRAQVIAGTAVWKDWDAGSVATNTDDALYHVSAVRLVNTAGTTVLEVKWV